MQNITIRLSGHHDGTYRRRRHLRLPRVHLRSRRAARETRRRAALQCAVGCARSETRPARRRRRRRIGIDGLSAGRRRSYCSYQQRRSVSAQPGASGSARPARAAVRWYSNSPPRSRRRAQATMSATILRDRRSKNDWPWKRTGTKRIRCGGSRRRRRRSVEPADGHQFADRGALDVPLRLLVAERARAVAQVVERVRALELREQAAQPLELRPRRRRLAVAVGAAGRPQRAGGQQVLILARRAAAVRAEAVGRARDGEDAHRVRAARELGVDARDHRVRVGVVVVQHHLQRDELADGVDALVGATARDQLTFW